MEPNQATDIKRVFALQGEYRWAAAKTTAQERIRKLINLKQAIIKSRDVIAKAIHDDFKKNKTEVEISEIHPSLDEINHSIKHLKKWMKSSRVGTPITLGNLTSKVQYEPLGRVLILAPWNYPFNLSIAPLVAAVAAGNCVMLKPSEKTQHISRQIKLLIESVFDEKEVAVFEGGGTLGDFLLTLPFDHFFFTGSPGIGKKVMKAASEHLATVTLELGGKSPVIIDESSSIDQAAKRIMWGKFINSGQTCVAPDYVFVPSALSTEFIERAKHHIKSFYGSDEHTKRKSVDYCRIVDDGNFERLQRTLEETISHGAKVEVGGDSDKHDRYISPTLVSNITFDSPIMQEEIFGPILPIITYENREDIVKKIQQRPKPLALYVFSKNRSNIDYFLRNTTAGGTVINNVIVHVANPNLPFGGVGMSGQGSYHGVYGFREFSHERAIMQQGIGNIPEIFYPPYKGKLQALVHKFIQRMDS